MYKNQSKSTLHKSLNIATVIVIVLSYLLSSGILLFHPQRALAATYTVTTNADSGAGSLRQAITDANASVGVDDVIVFSSAMTIQPTSALPNITDTVEINGYTGSPGGATPNTAVSPEPFNGTLTIELDGTNAGANVNGLLFSAGSEGSVVRGLVINRFSQDGISIFDANNITAAGNYLGTSTNGLTDLGNEARGFGSSTGTSSDNNTVGGINPEDRNLISGNSDAGGPNGNEGVSICDLCDDWTIQGNYV